MNRIVSTTAVALMIIFAKPVGATAAEIKVWTSRAIATVLAETGVQFERETGHKLLVISDLPPAFVRRARAGEEFDVFISGSSSVDEWINEGRIIAETQTNIARSGIGVEVRAGARKPDVSSVEAFKRTLLDAKSIAYLRVGSGIYVAGLLERLGIAQAIESKVTRPESDIVSELVAKGEVELGIVVITQILTTPGVDLVGPSGITVFHRVQRWDKCEFKSARRGQAIIEVPYWTGGQKSNEGTGNGAGSLLDRLLMTTHRKETRNKSLPERRSFP